MLMVLYNELGIVHCTYLGCRVVIFKKGLYSFVLIYCTFTKMYSIDPDEMQHFIRDFNVCRCFPSTKVNANI